ncbi:MAG TPA: phosphate transport system regulatory protein PhoU [candidate division Zixibacteria bacterium]|nr:phosphate transport system regulatory protein PhoU [candidate division Zixibacteria bacterium]
MEQRHFDTELLELKEKLLLLAAKAEDIVDRAIEALRNRNQDMAEQVLSLDKEADRLEMEIEEETISLMARHQPAAVDLRFLVGVLKINNDLERIGDHGVNIAQSALRLNSQPEVKPLIDIPRMSEEAVGMLRDSIDSFVANDPDKARRVCRRDDRVDALKDQIFRELLTHMMEKPEIITRAMELILVSRNLERVADLATNICEETIYIAEAKVIKHHADGR